MKLITTILSVMTFATIANAGVPIWNVPSNDELKELTWEEVKKSPILEANFPYIKVEGDVGSSSTSLENLCLTDEGTTLVTINPVNTCIETKKRRGRDVCVDDVDAYLSAKNNFRKPVAVAGRNGSMITEPFAYGAQAAVRVYAVHKGDKRIFLDTKAYSIPSCQ